MPAPLLWAALAAAPTAWAGPCVLAESLAEPSRGARPGQPAEVEIRQLYVAETARPDCRALWIPDLPADRLRSLDARVVRADTRTLRFGSERLSPAPGGWILHLPELRKGAVLDLRVRRAGDGAATPPPPVLEAVQTTLELRVDPDAPRLPDEPPAGERRLRHAAVRGPGAAGAAAVVFPADATDRSCTQDGAPGTLLPWGCLLPAAPKGAPVEWSWTEPRLRTIDEVPLPSGATLTVTVRDGALHASPAGGATGSLGAGFEGGPDGSVQLRLTTAAGRPVLPDRAAVLSQVAYAAIGASIPEPGLPLAFKGRKQDPSTVPEVVALVQARAVTGSLPHRGPLSPRRLVEIKRSGWATPWEQALLLTRYLRQLKLDATPVPVRPRTEPEGDGVTPTGFTAAVVVLTVDGERTWIDPTCRLCAPGELPPELWDAPALAEGVARTPAAPMGRIDLALDGGPLQVALDPAAALAVRRMLLAHPPSERGAALGAAFAGGAALRAQEGLATAGAPVRLDFDQPPATDGDPPALGDLVAALPLGPVAIELRQPAPAAAPAMRRQASTRPDLQWSVAVVAAGDGPPVLVERVEIPGHPPRDWPDRAAAARAARVGLLQAAPHAGSPDVPPPPEASGAGGDGLDSTQPAETP